MKNIKIILILSVMIFLFLLYIPAEKNDSVSKDNRVIPGVEVFLSEHLESVKGKRVGLITHPPGINSKLQSTVELFFNDPAINLVALYGPEHGMKGNGQAGEHVSFYISDKYDLPVYSLYGQTMRPKPDMLKNIDVMVLDLQDIGTRIYTYITTMAYSMQVCADMGIEFIVLDRPNPVSGNVMEGPVLNYPEFSSSVGVYPIPVRHGMTIGELAILFNEEFFKKKVRLTVIQMKNWERNMYFDNTQLPWIFPSPNIPSLDTTIVYPGQVFIEGTNISEGRGTTRPFEIIGAPWIDGYDLAVELNNLKLPGLIFRETSFKPTFSKYKSEKCSGVQLHIINREKYRPFDSTLHIISKIESMYPEKFKFHSKFFDKIMGTSTVRKQLIKKISVDRIISSFNKDLKDFFIKRKKYLLYQ